LASTAAQKWVVGQDRDTISALSILAKLHPAEPPAVGALEERTLPFASPATQNELEGQATDAKLLVSTLVFVHEYKGFVVASTFPKPSTATHTDVLLAHDTASKVVPPSIAAPLQLGASKGVEDAMRASPFPSTATHMAVDGQETPLIA
jgi:hypothetical protein